MKRSIIATLFFIFALPRLAQLSSNHLKNEDGGNAFGSILLMYNQLGPAAERPSYNAFYYAMKGFLRLDHMDRLTNARYLTIVDYSLASSRKRLWVIDVPEHRIVQTSFVAHGKNSGLTMARLFSNKSGSHKSSLGFFLTGRTYVGKHGFSLKLRGIEPGINDQAFERSIVIHPASYATEEFVRHYGRLGRSFGCLALPPVINKKIISEIKNESCLFIYYPDKEYLNHSLLLTGVKRPNSL